MASVEVYVEGWSKPHQLKHVERYPTKSLELPILESEKSLISFLGGQGAMLAIPQKRMDPRFCVFRFGKQFC